MSQGNFMKRMLFIALLIPSLVSAMEPKTQTQKPLQFSKQDKILLGVQGAAITYDILRTTTCDPFPYILPMPHTVLVTGAYIGGKALYNYYQNTKVTNPINNQ